ncbi:MAG: hypothetical protein Q9163_003593 [Psora crenata]
MEPASDLTLEGLSARISHSSKIISDCISHQGLEPLSLSPDGPKPIPIPPTSHEAHNALLELLEATELLHRLANGPIRTVDWIALAVLPLFDNVPLNSTITYADLAGKIGGQDVNRLRRLLRYGMTLGLFMEPQADHVAHSTLSAPLARDPDRAAFVRHCVEEAFPSTCHEADWLSQHPEDHGEPTESGFQLAFDTEKSFFDYIHNHPEKGPNFARAMSGLTGPGAPFDTTMVRKMFDWEALGEATVVDVGGGRGDVCIGLAADFPKLKFVVQDVSSVVEQGKDNVPAEFHPRFEYMAQDFFQPQPDLRSRGKVVYYMRFILHDWSNKYCTKILKNIVDVMEEGGTLLINDQLVPPMGAINRHLEKLTRMTDMEMLVLANAQERSAEDFAQLLAETDPRLKLVKIHPASGSPLAMVEVQLSATKNA